MLLDRGFPSLWLEAEVSNFARPASGHWYFSLKDSGAQLRCAMFRQRNMLTGITPKDGQQVLVRGRISLYEPRGDFQMIVDHLEDAGQGALKREFDRLKAKLAAEGLFDSERKRAPPRLPRRIGIITSPTGAAVRDILHVLKRRFPAVPVLIYPVPVQGAQAAPDIVAALQLAAQRADCDVLILARGGGSLEDLWAFNDEALARQIVASPIPVVTGIGHEVDFTIADFAADLRAPTPSAAAELVVPDGVEYAKFFQMRGLRLQQRVSRRLAELAQRLQYLKRRAELVSPIARLTQRAQQLDEFEQRLIRALRQTLTHDRTLLLEQQGRLWRASPALRLRENQARHADLRARMRAAVIAQLQRAQARFGPLVRTLHAVSPLATLGRGYAIVSLESGAIVTDASQVRRGDLIRARVSQGEIRAKVEDAS